MYFERTYLSPTARVAVWPHITLFLTALGLHKEPAAREAKAADIHYGADNTPFKIVVYTTTERAEVWKTIPIYPILDRPKALETHLRDVYLAHYVSAKRKAFESVNAHGVLSEHGQFALGIDRERQGVGTTEQKGLDFGAREDGSLDEAYNHAPYWAYFFHGMPLWIFIYHKTDEPQRRLLERRIFRRVVTSKGLDVVFIYDMTFKMNTIGQLFEQHGDPIYL